MPRDGNFNSAGLTWTTEHMLSAADRLREGNRVEFDFTRNSLDTLAELDEVLFKRRPDLFFLLSNQGEERFFSEDEIQALGRCNHIRKIHLMVFGNRSLAGLGGMKQLTHLLIAPTPPLDIAFLEELENVEWLWLSGKFKSLDPLAKLGSLETLILSTRVDSFAFAQDLPRLREVTLQGCSVNADLAEFNLPPLRDLFIATIRGLRDVDALGGFATLEKLFLDASRVERLPNLHAMKGLRRLGLRNMKSWVNPEVLGTVPDLRHLSLHSINTKLRAESFHFLSKSETLEKVDFLFIDYNKRRIAALRDWFVAEGREDLIPTGEIADELFAIVDS